MIERIEALRDLQFGQLMMVYEESNRKNGEENYPYLSREEQLMAAEQDFYRYLQLFFKEENGFVLILSYGGRYMSALRAERYKDGYLLEALETLPDQRNKGYGGKLVDELLTWADERDLPVYSHVSKSNFPSISVHKKCGFQKILDYAAYIDGSVNDRAYTLCYKK